MEKTDRKKSILIDILIIMGFICIASGNIFKQQLSNLDEIWIYNFGRCILNGLLPYKDFNIIITPLFAYISAFFLKLFGDEMIVLRFAEAVQTGFILFMVYKVFEKLKVNKGVSLISALAIYILFASVFCFDYNWAVLLIALIILYIEIDDKKDLEFNYKRDLLIGMLAGISILLKQTSGIIISAMLIFYKIVEMRKTKDIKEFVNIAVTRMLGTLLPLLLFAIYLTVNNIWTEFIDYAILGIKTFTNIVPYSRLFETDTILAYAIPACMVIIMIISIITLIFKKFRESDWSKNIRTLMSFDIATAVVIYPIADRSHFAIASICTVITIIYLIHLWIVYGLKVESEKVKKICNRGFNILAIIIFVIYIVIFSLITINYFKSLDNKRFITHFQCIDTDEEIYYAIEEIDNYIKSKNEEVLILDSMAAAINIPLDKYHKDYDMFNIGNFGIKGEEGIIEDLNSRHYSLLLVKKDYFKTNWQHPDNVVEYVKENYNKVDEVGNFDVYSK